MKKLILLIVLSAIACSVYAVGDAEVWFSPYPAAFNVDLEDTETYCGVQEDIGGSPSGSGYSDQTLIGVVGFGGPSNELGSIWDAFFQTIDTVSFEIEFNSAGEAWNYVSASEPYLKRPFGVDIVLNYFEMGSSGTSVLAAHLGYDNDKSQTNTKGTEFSVVLKEDSLPSGNFWIGIYLKLPDENVDLSSALSADDYYSSMNLSLTVSYNSWRSDDVFEWNAYIFNGYIGEEIDDLETQVFLNIVPDAQANSINVSDLEDGKSVTIGEYSYVSQAYLPESYGGNPSSETMSNANYYVFASSSPDPNLSGGLFHLVSTGIESAPSAENVIYYQVGIDSANISGTGTADKWYNGQDILPSVSTASLVEGDSRREQLSYDYRWFEYTRYYSITFEDRGSLMIRAADANGNPDTSFLASDYRAGVYTSTIYLHVVSSK